jgi:hypothetical protein
MNQGPISAGIKWRSGPLIHRHCLARLSPIAMSSYKEVIQEEYEVCLYVLRNSYSSHYNRQGIRKHLSRRT